MADVLGGSGTPIAGLHLNKDGHGENRGENPGGRGTLYMALQVSGEEEHRSGRGGEKKGLFS